MCIYLTRFCHLHAGINPRPDGLTVVAAVECAVMSWSTDDLLICNVPTAPSVDDNSNEDNIEPQKPALTCPPDSIKTKANRQVVGAENAEGTAYRKVTRLYNKHQMYAEQWNQCHPFRAAHNFVHVQLFCLETTTWIYYDLRCGLNDS